MVTSQPCKGARQLSRVHASEREKGPCRSTGLICSRFLRAGGWGSQQSGRFSAASSLRPPTEALGNTPPPIRMDRFYFFPHSLRVHLARGPLERQAVARSERHSASRNQYYRPMTSHHLSYYTKRTDRFQTFGMISWHGRIVFP